MITATLLLNLALLVGCNKPQTELPVDTAPSNSTTEFATLPSSEPTSVETDEDVEYEGDATSYYIDVVYAQQIERYYTAISQQWDENAYLEHEMSPLAAHY